MIATDAPEKSRTLRDPEAITPGPLLRTIEDLDHDDVFSERVYRLAEPRLVFADYALLQHDFPHLRTARLEQVHPVLRTLKGTRKEEAVAALLDRWLLHHTAFISTSQSGQEATNSPIATTDEHVVAFRPIPYGRALVYSLRANRQRLALLDPDLDAGDPVGLLDVKGTGVAPHRTPRRDTDHANGLLGLAWALREILFQALVEIILRREGSAYRTVPLYAVLAPGFEVFPKEEDKDPEPAAMIVRRAHRRPQYRWAMPHLGDPELDVELEVEQMLRKYGVTSSNLSVNSILRPGENGLEVIFHNRPCEIDAEEEAWLRTFTGYAGEELCIEGINIQMTKEVLTDPPNMQIVDFGAFNARTRFEHPMATLAARRLLQLGEIIPADDPRYVQPAYDLRLPEEIKTPPGADIPRDLLKNLASDFDTGKISGREVKARLDELIETATAGWD